MPEHSIAVFVIINDDMQLAEGTVLSLVRQTYQNFNAAFIFIGQNEVCFLQANALIQTYFSSSSITKINGHKNIWQTLNTMISDTESEYIALLSSGDIFHPERLSFCIKNALARDCSILISYVELLDAIGSVIPPDHEFFRTYTKGLLTNIANHPCLSFVMLWYDLIVSSGNIFFSKKLFQKIGGFRNFETLFVYDFFLRSSRFEEPAFITEKLISCRPNYRDDFLKEIPKVNDERVVIIRNHLMDILAEPPQNVFADLFTSHPFMFASVPWTQPLIDAVDGTIEKREIEKKETPLNYAGWISRDDKSKNIMIMTHELSLTGAPVIVLELATLLRETGHKVSVVSPTDGPLRKDFESRKIDLSILYNGFFPRLQFLQSIVSRPTSRLKPWGFLKWVIRGVLFRITNICKYQSLKKISAATDGFILINSVAAWAWVFDILKKNSTNIIWYIHETFDPKWMVHGNADELFRQKIADGSLKMLYGSLATCKTWTAEGYSGLVRYWSGIKSDKYPGDQLRSLNKNREKRMILNVGSFGARKGTRILLEAFALGRRQGIIPEDVDLCIIGSSKPSEHQEARDIWLRANRPDVQGHVRIVGNLYPDAISSYYDEADIYAHASLFDCMPISLLTAMARGLPIIATDVDGCGEAIIDQVSGLLVPPRSPQLLANGIARLLKDRELAERVSHGARKRFVDVFSVEATFEPLHSFIDQAIITQS